ncbi:MAG: carboxypeptidase M32 [Phycisphaerales bacterium]|nr:carboxypeptidase M32 [Phycisphaerales bacterium]
MTTTVAGTAYDRLLNLHQEGSLLGSTAEILSWDQETMMPSGGLEYRSRQMALLARLSHERRTDPRLEELLNEAEAEGHAEDSPEHAQIREIRRDYEMATRLPADLVEEFAKLSSVSQHVWADARKNSDFQAFKPHLEQLVELSRRKADCLGIPEGGERWDALADTYEPGMRASEVAAVFEPLRDRLSNLIKELGASSNGPSNAFNEATIEIDAQSTFVREIATAFGFDFERGRLDRSVHPFCGGSHCNDVRLTTRFQPTEFNDALGSTMHEAGHGLYEQGLPFSMVGLPLGEAISLGIHESQSRMWENQVGRSEAFWKWCAPRAKEKIGAPLAHLSFEDFYGGANIVRPGFIRVEADEATYNLHIMIRFELERAIIGGDLAVADIPGEWNRMYKDYLGLDVPEDRVGCLQDVHWSMGAMGYFPTYTLGNLYCAQFFNTACEQIPGLEDGFSRGEFAPLLDWLRENIHRHGRRYSASELCLKVTGRPLSSDPLVDYLENKLRPLYGI